MPDLERKEVYLIWKSKNMAPASAYSCEDLVVEDLTMVEAHTERQEGRLGGQAHSFITTYSHGNQSEAHENCSNPIVGQHLQ